MNLTNEDLLILEERAKKATPGPWCVQHPNAGVRGFEVADQTGLEQICADLTEPRARYIAAANPAVVLALINKVRELASTLQKVAEVAHCGGLRNYTESEALKEVRLLTSLYPVDKNHWAGKHLDVSEADARLISASALLLQSLQEILPLAEAWVREHDPFGRSSGRTRFKKVQDAAKVLALVKG